MPFGVGGGRKKLDLTYVQVGFTAGDLERIDAAAGSGRRGVYVREAVLRVLNGGLQDASPVPLKKERVTAEAVASAPEKVGAAKSVVRKAPRELGSILDPVDRTPSAEAIALASEDHPRWGDHNRKVRGAMGSVPRGAREVSRVTGLPEMAVERALERLAASGDILFVRGMAVAK